MSDEGTVIVVESGDESEVAEEVAEVAETVAEAVVDAVEAVAEAFTTEEQHGENVALLVGSLVATVNALTGRIETLESRTSAATATAEMATDIAISTAIELEEQTSEPEPEPEVVTVSEDESPPTRRSKFGSWFFGE